MEHVSEITKESWLLKTFPEWGTWLNEEIEQKVIEPGTFTLWWLGCTGVWLKSEKADLCIDCWFGTGKRTKAKPFMDADHQMARMSGAKKLQPNLRAAPVVLDPFAVKKLDALISTHSHNDHMDINLAAAVLKNCSNETKFIGPEYCIDRFLKWGVPAERCIKVKPGDKVNINDTEIIALESFDRTALITAPPSGNLKGFFPDDMNKRAVNYLIKTTGGNFYHSGDSHYSNMYAQHGREHIIDVALASFGENPCGITDKMNASDILRMGEALRTKVIIPVHYDIWTNFLADPKEILVLYNFKKDILQYKFKPFIWQVGGEYDYPKDKAKLEYHHNRGFDDSFESENNLPFQSFL